MATKKRRHRHVHSLVERVMGYDVIRCHCGDKKFVRIPKQQMRSQLALFEV